MILSNSVERIFLLSNYRSVGSGVGWYVGSGVGWYEGSGVGWCVIPMTSHQISRGL